MDPKARHAQRCGRRFAARPDSPFDVARSRRGQKRLCLRIMHSDLCLKLMRDDVLSVFLSPEETWGKGGKGEEKELF